jgi:TPR repeat protein
VLAIVSIYVPEFARADSDIKSGIDAFHAKEYDNALGILTPLAADGDAEAQYLLGVMYAEGRGVQQDFYHAGSFYRKAATQGHAAAQVNLGSLYDNCLGTGPCNPEKAAYWYRRAADQGNPLAQFNLAVMYATGTGVAKNEWTARIIFRQAAEAGVLPAQYNLAVSYELGLGGPADAVAAYAWYDLSATRGFGEAGSDRDRIQVSLSQSDQERARNLSRRLVEIYGKDSGRFGEDL